MLGKPSRARGTLPDLLAELAIGRAGTNQRRPEGGGRGGAGWAVSRERRSPCLAPRLPGHRASGEHRASSVVSVAGCLQLGKPRQTPASPSSSAPVRWLLFLFSRPVLLPCGGASPSVSPQQVRGAPGRRGFVRAVPSRSRAEMEPGSETGARPSNSPGLGSPGAARLALPPLGSSLVWSALPFSPFVGGAPFCSDCGGFEMDSLTGPALRDYV